MTAAAAQAGRRIVDPHVHFWDIRSSPGLPQEPQRFLLDELAVAVAEGGHAIGHTVFVECGQMYRRDGPDALRSLGETEFANGIAAASASGGYGPTLAAHRIVANVDLRHDDAGEVIARHAAAAGDRLAGVRMTTAYREDGLFGHACDRALRGALADPSLHEGARALAKADLVLDVWCVQSQLRDVATLADAVPDLVIVLDHCGTPEHRDDEAAFRDWAADIRDLALRPNMRIKLGGLGMAIDRPLPAAAGVAAGEALAAAWRPYIETCIEAFGISRAMFESNYPADRAAGSYGAIWDAFDILARGCAEAERDALFAGTAAGTYRIGRRGSTA